MRLRGREDALRQGREKTGAGAARRLERVGRFVAALGLGGVLLLLPATSRAETAGPDLRIAIAPFVGDDQGAEVSQQLSVRFARLGVARLIAPGSFVAEREFDPRADAVRTWAYQAAVDTIVVGRVEQPIAHSEAQQIEAVVRSGHSGAELFRHSVHVPARAGLGSALDQLAAAIVQDLGGDPRTGDDPAILPPTPAVSAAPETPIEVAAKRDVAAEPAAESAPVEANAAEAPMAAEPSTPTAPPSTSPTPPPTPPTPTAVAPKPSTPAAAPAEAPKSAPATPKSTKEPSALDARLGVGGFQSDAPIEIKADEAEIMAEGVNRKLVFKGAVDVKQDNVSVHSDLLEAEYEEGQSEPTRLVATGRVHVAQDNRSARCDRAEYLRVTQKITCRGHAELVQGCDVVRGELIVLELADNKARVEGAASIVISPKQNGSAACQAPGKKKKP